MTHPAGPFDSDPFLMGFPSTAGISRTLRVRPRRRHRQGTLAEARAKHPERFTTTTDPKILKLPGPA